MTDWDKESIETLYQATSYLQVIDKIIFKGRMSPLITLKLPSMAGTKLADLRFHHLRAFTTALSSLKKEPAELHFLALRNNIISDGLMATAGGTQLPNNIPSPGESVHPIQWSARQLRPVSTSSATAEIFCTADAFSNGLYSREGIAELCYIAQT